MNDKSLSLPVYRSGNDDALIKKDGVAIHTKPLEYLFVCGLGLITLFFIVI